MRYIESPATGIIFVTLGYGEDLLEGIRAAARAAGVHTGLLVTGIGSLRQGRLHIVETNELPPANRFIELPGPLEVTGYTGVIAAYEPHVHIAMTDPSGRFYGGHLEEGCQVLTLAEFSLLRVGDIQLDRQVRPGELFPTLGEG